MCKFTLDMSDIDHRMLDQADRRILREIQKDIRRSPEDMAGAVGMSVATYRRRLNRLRKSGVIQREAAILDPSGLGIEIIVLVTMMEEHASGYDRLKKRVRAEPLVTQCYSVTGEADLVLHVVMPDMASFESWITDFILADPAVRRCQSNVVYSRIKYETAVPV